MQPIAFLGQTRLGAPAISPDDRAFLLGDGCFETLRVSGGKADGIGGEFAAKPPLEARFRSIGGHSSGQYMTALLKMGL